MTLTRFSPTEPDPTNLVASWKAIEDALVTCRILAGDRSSNYEGGRPAYRWEHAPRGHGHVVIEVEA